MHINYENNEVKNLCTKKEYALKHIDSKVYTALKFVINFIENATSLIDVINYPSFHFHDLKGPNHENEWSIYIKKTGYRLILKPQDENNNIIEKGDVLANSKSIKIVLVTEVNNRYE